MFYGSGFRDNPGKNFVPDLLKRAGEQAREGNRIGIIYKEVDMDINKIIPGRIDNLNQSSQTNVKVRPDQSNADKANTHADSRLTKENVSDLVDVLNSAARSVNERVSFKFHEKANRVIMKVVDAKTDEVIREIPPKEMIKLLVHMHELIGMFVDESR